MFARKMKPIGFAFAAVLTVLSLISCASEHAPATGRATRPLVGAWESVLISHPSFFGKSISERNEGFLTIEFHQDGRLNGAADGDPINGYFETKGDQLTLKSPDEVDEMTFEVSGDKLKILDSDGFTILLERTK